MLRKSSEKTDQRSKLGIIGGILFRAAIIYSVIGALATYFVRPLGNIVLNPAIESNPITSWMRAAAFEMTEAEFQALPAHTAITQELAGLLQEHREQHPFDTIFFGDHYHPGLMIRRFVATPAFQDLLKQFDVGAVGLESWTSKEATIAALLKNVKKLEDVRTYWSYTSPALWNALDIDDYPKANTYIRKMTYQSAQNGIQTIPMDTRTLFMSSMLESDDKASFDYFEARRAGKNAALIYGGRHYCVRKEDDPANNLGALYGQRAVFVALKMDHSYFNADESFAECKRPPDFVLDLSANRVYRYQKAAP